MDKWKRPTSMNSRQNPKSGQQQQKQQQQQRSSPKATDTGAKQGNRPTTNNNNSGRTMPTKRNWTKPVDHHAEKHEGESAKRHERHINKFSKPPREGETVTQRKERKRKEEELANIMKQEAAAKRHMEQRQAKQRAKELAEKENRVRDVFIPEIVNVANLSKILGIRIGMSVRQQEKDLYINLCL
jgi:translation initiation factor IF-2